MITEPPETFLGVAVPDDIKQQWKHWKGAEWRRMRHLSNGNLFPPDQRHTVRYPVGLCPAHRQAWLDWRNHDFDPTTGDRWPGGPGSIFTIVGSDLNRVREERRCEWDEKTSGQMRLIEDICLSGRSPQCTQDDVSPEAAKPTVDVHLPELDTAA